MPDGTFVWEGQVRGFSSSRVLLVVNGARVSGEIALPGSLYHVRSLDAGIYIAQEINQTLVTERETRAFLNISVTDEVIALTNQERAKHGLHDLFYDYRLTLAAQGHADDMAQNNYFSHTSLDGRSPSQRITATGYIWNYAAENIAAGYTSAATVVNGWINSPGHHANMISPTSCDIGVGYAYNSNDPSMYYHYWVQNFGRLMGVSTCPAVPAGSKPDVSTGTATQAGMDSVQLNGTINPNGLVTTYYFEIGLTNAYGSTTTRSDTAAGTSPLSAQVTLTGLSRFTTYHYRLVAYNSRGITYGQDATFSIVDQVLPIGGLLLLLR